MIIITIPGGLLVVLTFLWTILRLSGIVEMYTISSPSNEPALQAGEVILATNLKEPALFEHVTFHPKGDGLTDEVWIFRLCGLPGDTVELINGVFFLNGSTKDDSLPLYHQYMVDQRLLLKLSAQGIGGSIGSPASRYQDSARVLLSKEDITRKMQARRIIDNAPNPMIQEHYAEPWNQDQFGPIVVPDEHYFVLGDSRNNSMDSRYIGPIHKDNLVGVRFW